MKFATIGHLIDEKTIESFPKLWIGKKYIISPEIDIEGTKGHLFSLKKTAKEIINLPKEEIRQAILDAALYAQNELGINLIQLGALTTSVTSGGRWFAKQKEYSGYVNHGDSYTAAVTCQTTLKALQYYNKKPEGQVIAIVGAYGIIGEAVSKLLVPKFRYSILIGRRKNKLEELEQSIKGSFETSIDLKTEEADVIITATSHPTALLTSKNLKKDVIVIDVSQPPNLSYEVCKKRTDVIRIDGGYVSLPKNISLQIPGIPNGKIFSCIAEIIMQAKENVRKNFVGSIDLKHLKQTEEWGKKHQFTLNELSNYGLPLEKKN